MQNVLQHVHFFLKAITVCAWLRPITQLTPCYRAAIVQVTLYTHTVKARLGFKLTRWYSLQVWPKCTNNKVRACKINFLKKPHKLIFIAVTKKTPTLINNARSCVTNLQKATLNPQISPAWQQTFLPYPTNIPVTEFHDHCVAATFSRWINAARQLSNWRKSSRTRSVPGQSQCSLEFQFNLPHTGCVTTYSAKYQ